MENTGAPLAHKEHLRELLAELTSSRDKAVELATMYRKGDHGFTLSLNGRVLSNEELALQCDVIIGNLEPAIRYIQEALSDAAV